MENAALFLLAETLVEHGRLNWRLLIDPKSIDVKLDKKNVLSQVFMEQPWSSSREDVERDAVWYGRNHVVL